MKDYKSINKKLWNDKTEVHLRSEFYDVESFKKGTSSLKHIELDLLGDIKEKKILHLQCHFGMDTISMARMGAHVTGVDLSDKAINAANQLKQECNVEATFINSDVYDLMNVHHEKYDIVFSSYGTIGWLPDMDQWAEVVHHFLKPSGKLILIEFHPVVWMMSNDFRQIEYSYFNAGPIEEITEGSYADNKAEIKNPSISWNHPLSDVFSSLLKKGLQITHFSEYDYSVYDCFDNTVKTAPGRYQIKDLQGLIPMMYSLTATR
jgi:ubiquinone/menaquinone biosynthesis C-methylase UbiE